MLQKKATATHTGETFHRPVASACTRSMERKRRKKTDSNTSDKKGQGQNEKAVNGGRPEETCSAVKKLKPLLEGLFDAVDCDHKKLRRISSFSLPAFVRKEASEVCAI